MQLERAGNSYRAYTLSPSRGGGADRFLEKLGLVQDATPVEQAVLQIKFTPIHSERYARGVSRMKAVTLIALCLSRERRR